MGCSLPEALHSPVHKHHPLGKPEGDTDLNTSSYDFLGQKHLDTIVVATKEGTGESGISITGNKQRKHTYKGGPTAL